MVFILFLRNRERVANQKILSLKTNCSIILPGHYPVIGRPDFATIMIISGSKTTNMNFGEDFDHSITFFAKNFNTIKRFTVSPINIFHCNQFGLI